MGGVEQLLAELGFGEYEARAYVALLQRSPLTGYELAKVSGVPRGNVYAVLEKLQGRAAVVNLDTPDGTRYAAVPPQEMLRRMSDHYQQTLERAECALDEVGAPLPAEYVWNAHGYPVLLDHARGLIDTARRQLLMAVWPPEARALAGSVSGAAARGVEIDTLCLAGCPHECGACRGQVYRYRIAPAQATRWLIAIADEAEVLAGEITLADEGGSYAGGASGGEIMPAGEGPARSILPGEGRAGTSALAVRTRQRLLVEVIAAYIRDSIALATLLSVLAPGMEASLPEGPREALASIHTCAGGSWLGHLRTLLAVSEETPEPERAN